MPPSLHEPRPLSRTAMAAALFATCVSPKLAFAADGPEVQRPQHVARSVNGVASTPSSTVPTAATRAPAAPAPVQGTLAQVADDPRVEPDSPRNWKHSGFVMDAKMGMLGCLRTICAGPEGHGADPGLRVGGFLGGNVGGILEVGVQGAWGRLRPDVGQDENVLDLYGIDTAGLQQQIDHQTGGMAEQLGLDGLDLDQLSVQDAKLQSAHAGLALRLHFVPRGRFDAWAGSGIGYELFRADYVTPAGDVRVDFHGLGVPAQGGMSVFLTRRLALGAEFEYRWTHFGVGSLQHPMRDVAVPMSVVAAQGFGAADIAGQLPRYWTAGVNVRLRV